MLMNVMIVEIILFFCKKIKEGGNMNSIQKYRGLAIADYFVKKCIEQNIRDKYVYSEDDLFCSWIFLCFET